MNPQLLSIDAAQASKPPSLKVFCSSSRAVITRSIHTQGALFASIKALAASALDGNSDPQETLFRIDLLATAATADAEKLANAVGTLPTSTDL